MIKRKYYCLLIVFIVVISCSNHENKYSNALIGEWQVEKLLHGNKDYSLDETYILSFSLPSELWIHSLNHNKKISVSSKFEVSNKSDSYFMDITSNDKNINGNYNIYIDTIQENQESYFIRLRLDSEKTYIHAIRQKLKRDWPD